MDKSLVYIVGYEEDQDEFLPMYYHRSLEGAKRSGSGVSGDGCFEEWEQRMADRWLLGNTGVGIRAEQLEN